MLYMNSLSEGQGRSHRTALHRGWIQYTWVKMCPHLACFNASWNNFRVKPGIQIVRLVKHSFLDGLF